MSTPLVAIVGRPNVGKSTLFNRLIGRREAIVSNIPGTTRDRLIAPISWDGFSFILVDTGGLEPRPQDIMRDQVKAQVTVAVEDADLILFLLDVATGLTPTDQEIAAWLRRSSKPIVVAVNKVDSEKHELLAPEFYRLGLGDPQLISAYHNLGIYELMSQIESLLPKELETEKAVEDKLQIAIVGRTNVGKSMLTNSILGQERAIVSSVPGTTRDALDTHFTYNGDPMVLIDTAGIRRPGSVKQGIERYSVLRAVQAVQRCDIAFLLMDATELATAQDMHIAGLVWDTYKGMVVVVSKWDLIPKEQGAQELVIQTIRKNLHFASYAPICFTSALFGTGMDNLIGAARATYDERQKQQPHGKLYYAVQEAIAGHLPPSHKGKPLVIKEVRQVDVNPPTFLFTVNNPALVHFSYRRYLENRLRRSFGYTHTHLRLLFKKRT
jgi:GTP-binding protein